MKTLIKGDPVTAAARTEVGIIPTFLIFSLGFMAGLVLFVMLRTDWSVVMPYYHADGPEQIAVFDNSRGKTALMEAGELETFGETVTVTTSSTTLISIGGAVGPAGTSSNDRVYQLYYRYFPGESGARDTLVVLAGPSEEPVTTEYVNVEKFSRELTDSFLRNVPPEDQEALEIHFFRMSPHTRPIWLKYAVYLAFLVVMLFWILVLPGFSLIQRHTKIGRRIAAFGPFEDLKRQILEDWKHPIYSSFTQFVGRRCLMLNEQAGRRRTVVWYFYPLTEVAQVSLEPDPADYGNCFVLTLTMKDKNQFRLLLYTTEPEARSTEAALRLHAGTPENTMQTE